MEWVSKYHGQVIGLDSAPLIYFIEQNPDFLSTIEPFFEAMDSGQLQVVTSTITLLEVLVHPLRLEKAELVQTYKETLLNAKGHHWHRVWFANIVCTH